MTEGAPEPPAIRGSKLWERAAVDTSRTRMIGSLNNWFIEPLAVAMWLRPDRLLASDEEENAR